MLTAMIFLLVLPAGAREYRFDRRVTPHQLQNELRDAGFRVHHIVCAGTKCALSMPDSEKKDPAPIIAAHRASSAREAAEARRSEARGLAVKLKAGSASATERDRLLLLLSELVLGD